MTTKWIILIVSALWLTVTAVGVCAAEEKAKEPSAGESIGQAARQIGDDSKKAYQDTKEEAVKTSKDIAEESKKAYQEARDAGIKMVDDVKKGFEKGGSSSKEEKK